MMSFIVMFVAALTRFSESSILSIKNIDFKFSLCEMDARLHVSAVTLVASFIAYFSYSPVTLNTASRIFTLGNGIFWWSLKSVMVLYNSV